MRVFVNAEPLEVGKGADVRAAVLAHDAALEPRLAAGAAYVTDARGIELPLDAGLGGRIDPEGGGQRAPRRRGRRC